MEISALDIPRSNIVMVILLILKDMLKGVDEFITNLETNTKAWIA